MNYLIDTPSESFLLSGMSGAFDEAQVIYNVADGTTGEQLKADKREVKKTRRDLMQQGARLEQIPEGPAKVGAQAAYARAAAAQQQTESKLAQAIQDHDKIADAVKKYTVGLVSPRRVGLSAFPVIPVVVVAAALAASGVMLFAFSEAVRSVRGDIKETKGLIGQTTDAINAATGTILGVGSTFTKTAWAVAGVLGAVLAFQFLQDWRKGRRRPVRASSGPKVRALPAPGLKRVQGEVLS